MLRDVNRKLLPLRKRILMWQTLVNKRCIVREGKKSMLGAIKSVTNGVPVLEEKVEVAPGLFAH